MQWRILIVDDEEHIRSAFYDVLCTNTENCRIDLADSGEEAITLMKENSLLYDIVLTDEKMGRVSGTELLKWIKKNQPETDVVVVTAHGDIEKAVTAMKLGAANFIAKPVELTRLRQVISDLCQKRQLVIENRALKNRVREYDDSMIVGNSRQIRAVYEKVDKVADTDAVVLIQGESGTGKEVIARTLHYRSIRRKKPFVVVNCAALPPTLLENELFGHEREAFTGASSTRKGRFEQAHTGTIFLDEVTEMSLENQSRFLRVLEDGGFHRIGGTAFLTVDVRVIAASNKDVGELTKQGRFREDLYYRLNVVPVHIPPLRERKGDVPVLAQAFLREFAVRYNKENLKMQPDTLQLLDKYDWPGNVRELRNTVERAVILAGSDTISPEAFPELSHFAAGSIRSGERTTPIDMPGESQKQRPTDGSVIESGMTLSEIERKLIAKTLQSVGGHRRKAAELLGISVRALQYKIKDYNLI
jgi:DNA-binding NtrC family response regulator